MKAAYKWRIQNGLYAYITDEEDNGPFVYDTTTYEREYSGGTIVSGSSVNEGTISNLVSRMTKEQYTRHFDTFKSFITENYPEVSLLDVTYYYSIESDECSTSASSLKCAVTDIIFRVSGVTFGDNPDVVLEAENTSTVNGDVIYNMSFVLPSMPFTGGSVTFSSVTTENILSDSFIKNRGTDTQYLMADGSTTTLSGGSNVTITKDSETGVVTISAQGGGGQDTNTWRRIKVDNNVLLGNGINTGDLDLSGGTNVTLTTSSTGTVMISSTDTKYTQGDGISIDVNDNNKISCTVVNTDTHRPIQVKGVEKLGNNTTPLDFNEGKNITISYENASGVVITAEGYYFDSGLTNVTLFDASDTGLKYTGLYGSNNKKITTDKNPRGIINISDFLVIGNKSYEVVSIYGGPFYIELSTSFDNTGTASGAKIYKINQTGTTDRKNVATAERSFATGTGTVAYKKSMTVVGEYNDLENNANKSDILFAVGNGTSTQRSNAFIVRKDGSIHIHSTEDPTGGQHYGGRIDFGNTSVSTSKKANVYIEESEDNKLNFKADYFEFTPQSAASSVCIDQSGRTTATVNGVSDVYLGLPIGSITMWAGNTAPSGWLLCNGEYVCLGDGSQGQVHPEGYDNGVWYGAKYQKIINVISTTFGVSGNEYGTHYKLPDLQQRFPLGAKEGGSIGKQGTGDTVTGWPTSLAATGGTSGQTLSVNEMPSHNHGLDIDDGSETVKNPHTQYTVTDTSGKVNGVYTNDTGSNVPHNNIPPYLAINFIIKYK